MIVWSENLINKKYYADKEKNLWFDDLNKNDQIWKI
jgi:hypothetical protein